MSSGARVYTQEFKEAIVEKFLNRGDLTMQEFSQKHQLPTSTVFSWSTEYAKLTGMKNKSFKSKYTPDQILKYISETYSMNEEELGLYLRKNGLHSHQIKEWKEEFLKSVTKSKSSISK
jgi:transposase